MNTNTTLNRGAADLPEALHRSTAADGKTELFNIPGYPLMVRAVDFNRLHAESEMRRAALLDEMQKAALAAGQATAAQQEAAYAALPTSSYAGRVYEEGFLIGTCPLYTADQMRAFADATHALRASHGQAPADSAQEDAARYRLLRRGQHWGVIDGTGSDLRAEALDAAVDAARKQGESHDR